MREKKSEQFRIMRAEPHKEEKNDNHYSNNESEGATIIVSLCPSYKSSAEKVASARDSPAR